MFSGERMKIMERSCGRSQVRVSICRHDAGRLRCHAEVNFTDFGCGCLMEQAIEIICFRKRIVARLR